MEEQKFQELVLTQLEQLNKGQTTMQGDITNMKGDISTLKSDVSTLKSDVADLRQNQARIESDFGAKITALFDAREVQQEVNQRIFSSLDRLEAKVDVLQMETAYLKRIK